MSIEYTTLITSIYKASKLLEALLRGIRITFRLGKVHIDFVEEKSIDDRISKIDDAKKSLSEAISAIDELHDEAERNKKELNSALSNLTEAEKNKAKLEEELVSIRQIIKSDVGTFQTIAGIPSENEIKRERVIGFFTGVVASMVATGIIWIIVTFGSIALKNLNLQLNDKQSVEMQNIRGS